ncbi:TetR family transcriptional regulator [Pseudomonas citronellolis]|jgi:AcrR family transcriptional regulator|uniref:TetR family transcriptional regulator n=1 Tax=Pseudomonas citronellolis TaxID=53408 RepID=A0A1A9KFX1_9PSED|nr:MULTISPECIES: TetR family transcriptional regulator [Pseudomonas]KSW27357.1 TetR family transcriptional regulator [Pseudomonas sp. ADP]ANI15883.1 TetR family transcriptional regulator [Pseudomonas citronellolis]KRV66388.1 TetR family transcriptional regulator [Pseudomonas citronellolis]KRW76968.1 TetR family transcriptional regulator [Pseudomonas citronellolis]KWR81488.1 TetR family transcriptional regulator [Pseudomonas sp. PI1]
MSLEPDAVTQRQDAPGKRLLMEAALRLASSRRSLSSIGLRELAREAGLNPNTFYRHFADVDDLGLAIIRDIATQLRQPLRELRREAAGRAPAAGGAAATPLGLDFARGQRVCEETVRLFFDFVERHPEAFIIGVRELHGPSAVLREALGQVMDDFGADMAEDIALFRLLPEVPAQEVAQLSRLISRQLFQLSLDYLELPEGQRGEVCALAERQVLLLFTGAAVLQALGL